MKPRRPASLALLVICLAFGLFVVAREPVEMPGRLALIIDTDAGTDDLVAIAYLLSRPDVDIQMIGTVNGLAHAEAGARNVLRLLRGVNRRIPVYVGADQPLEGRGAFPAAWRVQADELSALPVTMGRRPRPDAVSAMLDRLRSAPGPISVLALGPLTNVAAAVAREPRTMARISQLVVMGGAIDAPGNAPEGGTPVAEWNIYVDPTAAALVLKAELPLTLIPLDATNHVPIDRAMLEAFASSRLSPLGQTVRQLLESNAPMIDAHAYFAWDPLAAVALTDPPCVTTRPMNVVVIRNGDEAGRLVTAEGDANAEVAIAASPQAFRRDFFGALARY